MTATGHCWDDVLGEREHLLDRTGRERRLGRRPALLLIDVYRKVFGDRPEPIEQAIQRWPATCGLAAWAALEPLAALLARAREQRVPVIHTTGESRPEARLGGATTRRREGTDAAQEYEIVEAVAPLPGEPVIYKGRASAFFDTPLASWLRQLDADTLVVGGETTSGCVRASVVDAFSHGFHVAVVEEAVFDRSPLSHKVNLYDLHTKYATVVHLDDALQYLADPAGHRLAVAG